MEITKHDALIIIAIVIGLTFAPAWRILYLNHLVGSANDLFVWLCNVPSFVYVFVCIVIIVVIVLLLYCRYNHHEL